MRYPKKSLPQTKISWKGQGGNTLDNFEIDPPLAVKRAEGRAFSAKQSFSKRV
jgi:hypothetical protein